MDRRLSVSSSTQQRQLKDKNKKRRKSVGDASDAGLNLNNDITNDTSNVSTAVTTTSINTSNNQNDALAAPSGNITGVANNQQVSKGIRKELQQDVIDALIPKADQNKNQKKDQNNPDQYVPVTIGRAARTRIEQQMKDIMDNLDENDYKAIEEIMKDVWFGLFKEDRKYLTRTTDIQAELDRRKVIADAAIEKIRKVGEKVDEGRDNIGGVLGRQGGDLYLQDMVEGALGTKDTYGLADTLKDFLQAENDQINEVILREYVLVAANEINANNELYTDESIIEYTDELTGNFVREPYKQYYVKELMKVLINKSQSIEKAAKVREEYSVAENLTDIEVLYILDADKIKTLPEGATLAVITRLSELYGYQEDSRDEQTVTEIHLAMMGDTPTLRRQTQLLGSRLPIDTMIAREREFQKDYYVFYHAHPAKYRVLRRLNERLQGQWSRTGDSEFDMEDNFTWLRAALTEEEKAKEKPKLSKSRKWDSQRWIDETGAGLEDTEYGAILVSTNLSIFGNTLNDGESTAQFFLNNQAANDHTGDLFNKAAQELGIPSGVLTKELNSYFKGASMMQIFIPKGIVDDVAFLSKAGGSPPKLDIASFLEEYTNSPDQVGPLKEYYQARLIMSQDAFHDPKLGVKMFEYNTMDKKKNNEMLSTIDDLVTTAESKKK